MMRRQAEQGDTIVEVVVAFAIFALAAVGSMQILSKGVATTQRDLEMTLVREQVDSQAEMIRYIRDGDSASLKNTWTKLTSSDSLVSTPSPLSASCSVGTSKAFYIKATVGSDPSKTTFSVESATNQKVSLDEARRGNYTYAQMTYNKSSITGSNGIWIEVARAQAASTKSPQAYDFYIHACWDSVGVGVPMTSGTIVRIYE